MPPLKVTDFKSLPSCIKGYYNALRFTSRLIETIMKLHEVGIVYPSLVNGSLKLTSNCDFKISYFAYAVPIDHLAIPMDYMYLTEPHFLRAYQYRSAAWHTEKIDVWRVTEFLYYLTHDRLLFERSMSDRDYNNYPIYIDAGLPEELAHIIDMGLKSDIYKRVTMAQLKKAIDELLANPNHTILTEPKLIYLTK